MKNKILYIVIILLALIPLVGAAPINWTITDSNTSYSVDLVNSTYIKPFMYYLMVSNNTGVWEFPVLGGLQGVMGIFFDAFTIFGGGSIIYLVLWGLFILIAWKNSGSLSVPSLAAVATAGLWSLLMPESSQPWCSILLVVGLATLLLNLFTEPD